MKVREKKWIRVRIYLVAGFFVLGLAAIVGRVYQLQVIQRPRLLAMAREGYVSSFSLPPKRGTIYDRKGHELALSVEVGSVFAHPAHVKDKPAAARALAEILGEKRESVLATLQEKRPFVWLKRRIPTALGEQVMARQIPGVGVANESRRYYPARDLAAHVIGFAGTDNQGLEGLERGYDDLLLGPQMKLVGMRDALGRPFAMNRPERSQHPMHSLVLTLDKDIQYRAQEALRSAVAKARARSGHCLVVDPDTGEILAMAVVPGFNPNVFSEFRPEHWRNRAVTDTYEPGSTMKAFLLAAGLEEAVVTPLTNFDCERGQYRIGKHTIRDTHEHGSLSVADIVVQSSNIGAIKIGQQLGYATYHRYLQKFGFGEGTGIDLLGERSGFLRAAKEARVIDQATVFFGQGLTVTSLQLAMGMAAIANGGKLMRPYVVSSVQDESGRRVRETLPKVVRRAISEETARKVRQILEGVASQRGTAPQAAVRGFRVAGKTGTAQKVDPETKLYSRDKFLALFVGFLPAEQPRLVILVVIDEPRGLFYGGQVAAPVFREVGEWALHYLRIDPQIQTAEAAGSKASPPIASAPAVKAGVPPQADEEEGVPDFMGLGMREVLRSGHSLGLRMVLEGSGHAVRQDPAPGAARDRATTVRVWFRPPTRS